MADVSKELSLVEWAQSQQVPTSAEIAEMVDGTDLPPGQRKILAVKLLPQCAFWSTERKSELAGVSSRYWRKCHKAQSFRAACADVSRRYLGHKVPEIAAAFVRDALFGNNANQVELLRQVGVLDRPKSGGDNNTNVYIVTAEMRAEAERKERANTDKYLERRGVRIVTD